MSLEIGNIADVKHTGGTIFPPDLLRLPEAHDLREPQRFEDIKALPGARTDLQSSGSYLELDAFVFFGPYRDLPRQILLPCCRNIASESIHPMVWLSVGS